MAVVGGGYAVIETGKGRVHLKGFIAWIVWALVHVVSLAQPALRLSVFLQWMWTLLTHQRGSRLIEDEHVAIPEGKTTSAHLIPAFYSK
jgi:hypothetical protein